ncbi:hypothetical protein CDA63_10565 [Hymenobacter amundsenii]|uniref:LysM domain-containing protein n=1 Tax=Hymenobacter amundsenii TaxID=2006685 RepID=A0A246FKQ7_9BACT|nr:LysM peptidoglycan-binding domain-containing protein [Hymenobacter amundsenii]OWP63131.1 hypothetical protein CDA63_10565 [Hymenobacter amundsenii]
MMSRFPLLTVALVFSGFCAWAAPAPVALPDSIGVEYRNNKMLIRHRVTAGETLYGLSRRYKVPVEEIVEANSGQKGQLILGQIVLVPRTRVVLTPAPARPAAPVTVAAPATAAVRALSTDANGNRVYKVTPGMTLYAIARRFQTTPAELARLNSFETDYNVKVGDVVIIAAPATGAAGPPAPVATAPARPTAREKAAERDAARDKARDEANSPAVTAEPDEKEAPPARANEIVRRVSESGLATVIPTDASDKYLALHKTAPVAPSWRCATS